MKDLPRRGGKRKTTPNDVKSIFRKLKECPTIILSDIASETSS